MTNNKKYFSILVGLFCCFVGGIIFLNTDDATKNKLKNKFNIYFANHKPYKDKEFVPAKKTTPVNYFYDEIHYASNNKKTKTKNKPCKLTAKIKFTVKNIPVKNVVIMPTKIIRGNLLINSMELAYLKPNTDVIGNVYIKDLNFLKLPKNFRVFGNIYIINSHNIDLNTGNYIDGNVIVKKRGSLKPISQTTIITGQILTI